MSRENSKPFKLLAVVNILAGLFYGFLFFTIITWGIDDDADPKKVAWGHQAVRHFIESMVFALRHTFYPLVLNWLGCIILSRQITKATKGAVALTLLFLAIVFCGIVMGCTYFYIYKPRGI